MRDRARFWSARTVHAYACVMTNAATKPNPVRAAREAVGLAREKLAARAGLSTSTLYLAERGVITQATAEKLAPILGVSAQELQS